MTSRRALSCLVLTGALALGLGVVMACGSGGVGIDACRQIETARCQNAPSCGIDLSLPVHNGDSPNLEVGACIEYYKDACLHGLVTTVSPGSAAVQACVDTLNNPTTSCDVIRNPETAPACSFLVPPADVDAATE